MQDQLTDHLDQQLQSTSLENFSGHALQYKQRKNPAGLVTAEDS